MLVQKKMIISRLFDFDPSMMAFLFDPIDSVYLRADPDLILFDSWELSPEKQLMVRAALDIWSNSGNLFLWEISNGLGQDNIFRIYSAVTKYKSLQDKNSDFPGLTNEQ